MRGIAYVFIEAFVFAGRFERKPAACVEIKRPGLRLCRRPCIVLPPYVCAGLEYIGLRESRAFALQIVLKERELNVGAEKFGCLGGELHIAQMVSIGKCPSSMHPGTYDERVGGPRIVLLDGAKGLEGPGKILRIKPAADHHHRTLDVFHVPGQVPRPPIVIVGCV